MYGMIDTWIHCLYHATKVRPPTPGKYIVRLYARGHQDKDSRHAWAVDYSLNADGYFSPSGFPTTYSTSCKAVMVAPLLNPLTVGMTVNVSVKVMGFHKVLCKPSEGGDKSEIFLQRCGHDTMGYSLFEGPVTIASPGKLAVAGIVKNSKIHNVFGVYQVVKR